MNANFEKKVIEMTKAESKKAGIYGSDEYNQLVEMMRAFPGFTPKVVTTKTTCGRFARLKVDDMRNYIKAHDAEGEVLAEFNMLRGVDDNDKRIPMTVAVSHSELINWFLEKYPEIEANAAEIEKIVKQTRKSREAKKAA